MFALKFFLLTPQILYCYRVQFRIVTQKWELKTQLVSVFVCVCVNVLLLLPREGFKVTYFCD